MAIIWLIAIYGAGVLYFILGLIASNGIPGNEKYEPSSWDDYIEFSLQWPRWVLEEIVAWVKSR